MDVPRSGMVFKGLLINVKRITSRKFACNENSLMRNINYTNPDNRSRHYLIEEVKNTFLDGALISTFWSLVNFYGLYSIS